MARNGKTTNCPEGWLCPQERKRSSGSFHEAQPSKTPANSKNQTKSNQIKPILFFRQTASGLNYDNTRLLCSFDVRASTTYRAKCKLAKKWRIANCMKETVNGG